MTPEERAEKIFRELPGYPASPCTRKEVSEWEELSKAFLATHIAEAEREAVAHSSMVAVDMDKALRQEFEAGFAAAKAKAAFLAHQWADNVYNGNGEMQLVKWIRELAASIEALEP